MAKFKVGDIIKANKESNKKYLVCLCIRTSPYLYL